MAMPAIAVPIVASWLMSVFISVLSLNRPNFRDPSWSPLSVSGPLPGCHRPLGELDNVVDDDPDDGQDDEHREGELDVHGAGALEQDVAQALIGTDELGDDCGRRSDSRGGLHAGEDHGERRRNAQIPEGLPGRRTHRLGQVEVAWVEDLEPADARDE